MKINNKYFLLRTLYSFYFWLKRIFKMNKEKTIKEKLLDYYKLFNAYYDELERVLNTDDNNKLFMLNKREQENFQFYLAGKSIKIVAEYRGDSTIFRTYIIEVSPENALVYIQTVLSDTLKAEGRYLENRLIVKIGSHDLWSGFCSQYPDLCINALHEYLMAKP